MVRMAYGPALLLCVTGCTGPGAPSDVERQTAIWKWQEAVQDAALDAESIRHRDAITQARASQDAAEQRDAARYAEGVEAQQKASVALAPLMHACVTAGVHRQAMQDRPPPAAAAQAILAECRPSIEAVARTVEVAGLSSAGLAHDIAARLWPRLVAGITLERAQWRKLHLPPTARRD